MRFQLFTLVCLVVLHARDACGQNSEHAFNGEAYRTSCKRYLDKKIGAAFYPVDEWTTLDGGKFDLGAATSPTIFFLGFSTCSSCRTALPAFAGLSTEPKYANYNFVYMTFDDTVTLRKEFSKLAQGNRVIGLSVSKKYIGEMGLAAGYPTIYFIDSKKVVKAIYAYGGLAGPIDSKSYWYPMLDSLNTSIR